MTGSTGPSIDNWHGRARDLAIALPPITREAPCSQVFATLKDNPDWPGLAVIGPDGEVMGLVSRSKCLSTLAKPFMLDLLNRRSIEMLMDERPLIIDAETTIDEISELILAGNLQAITDGFVVVEAGRYCGLGNADSLLEANQRQTRLRSEWMEQARLAAEAANISKSRFLANMSHELRTPLNAIIGYSELVQEELLELGQESLIADIGRIRSAGRHLLALINDILDLSKIEAGKTELYNEEFDVFAMLTEAADTVLPLMDKKANRLIRDFSEDLGRIFADLTKVRQSLFNLLSNAAKFTESGTITLSARRSDDVVVFSVADSGIGMTEAQSRKLFEPFIQADSSTTRKYGGTGLGLSITRAFVEMMGGRIELTSVHGQGTTFTITLPLAPPMPAGGTLPATSDPAVFSGDSSERNKLVLVIDDDEQARDLLDRMLRAEGYEVVGAADADQAIALAADRHPAAITLDVLMPGKDGWAILARLKSDPALSAIPVVMITMAGGAEMSVALGAADFLSKPVEKADLARIMARFRPDHRGHVLVIDDDPESRTMLTRLSIRSGWSADEAIDGQDGLEKLDRRRPDVILLDLMMPRMDGFEFVSELRGRPFGAEIPIVVLTAKDLTRQEQVSLAGSVRRVLQKGAVDPRALAGELGRLIAKRTTS